MSTLKKLSMYIPLYGVIAAWTYGMDEMRKVGIHFFLTAIVHAIYNVTILMYIIQKC